LPVGTINGHCFAFDQRREDRDAETNPLSIHIDWDESDVKAYIKRTQGNVDGIHYRSDMEQGI